MRVKPNIFLLLTIFSFSLKPYASDIAGDLILKYLKKSKPKKKTQTRFVTKKEKKKFESFFNNIVARSLFERKKSVSMKVLKKDSKVYRGKGVFQVYGTSFGKPGNKGESRYFKDGSKVKWGLLTAALPDNSAVGRKIKVRRVLKNGKKTRWVQILIRDLGPWFRDDPYWKTKSAPRAVYYFKHKMRRWDKRVVKNPAGIDLTPWVWQRLGVPKKESMNYSGYVEWKFVK
jgi:hypothetical protein